LEPYAKDGDLEYYKSLYGVHYASSTFEYDNGYIGDGVLLLASKMIADGNENKKEILKAISESPNALWECEYENGLFEDVDYSLQIDKLRQLCSNSPDSKFSSRFLTLLTRKYKQKELKIVKAQQIAFYDSSRNAEARRSAYEQILSKGCNVVEFEKQSKKAGFELFDTNKKFAALKAGNMMLDAMDSGAEVLMVTKDSDSKILKQHIGLCEKVVGRDIRLTIITRNDLTNTVVE